MKTVKLNGDVYVRYFFRYHMDKRTGTHEQTDCEIINADTKEPIAHDHVCRWAKDPDNKKVARKYAFDKAVKQLTFPADRARMWEHFMENQRI